MEFIKKLIEKKYINPAMGRSIEIFLVSNLITLGVVILESIEVLISQWTPINWGLIFGSFLSTIVVGVISGLKKYLRDMAN